MCHWHNCNTQSHKTLLFPRWKVGRASWVWIWQLCLGCSTQSVGPRSWNTQMRAADTGVEQCCRRWWPVKLEGIAKRPKEPTPTLSREIPPLPAQQHTVESGVESGRRTGAEIHLLTPSRMAAVGAGEVDQQLGAFTALVEDLNWVPRTHIWLLPPTSTLYLQGIQSPLQAPVCIFTDTYMEI